MSMSNSGLFENLLGSKTAEAQGAPAGRVFGTRSETKADFATFLKAELQGRLVVVPSRPAPIQAAEFKSFLELEPRFEAEAAEGTTEAQPAALAWPEFFDLAEEAGPEAGPAAPENEAALPGLDDAGLTWPTEPAFPGPVEMAALGLALNNTAPAAASAELSRFEAAPEAAPETQPASGDLFAPRNETLAERAAETGRPSEEPPVQAAPSRNGAPRPGPALTSAFEKYDTPVAPAPRPAFTPAAPAVPAPSAGGDKFSIPSEARPETVRLEAARPGPDQPGAQGPPIAEAESVLDSALTSDFEKYAIPPAATPSPARPTPGAVSGEAPVNSGPIRPALTRGIKENQAPVAAVPQRAPTIAPSAGGDEENEVLSFGPSRPNPALMNPGAKENKAPLTFAPPAFDSRPAPTVFAPIVSAPTTAPSAGGDEEAEILPDALASLLNASEDQPESTPRPASPAPWLAATLNQGRGPRPGSGDWPGLAGGILARSRLNLASGQVAAPVLGEAADPAALTEALDRARLVWPAPFRKQVGLGLVALGRPGRSANSMTAGAALLGASSPGEVLQNVLSGLKGELKVLKLPPRARDDLGRILAGSGLDQERLGRIMAGFGRDGLSLETLNKQLAGLDLGGRGQGLIATEAGLTEMARFLGSLGASTEVIDQALNSVKPGQPVTGEVLRDIFRHTEVGGLARNLGPGDIKSLAAFLREMGAGPQALEKLENQLWQTSGQMPLESFLDFLDGLKEPPVEAVSAGEMKKVKTLLEQVSRDDGLARPPVFNEILIKLRALGDPDIDDDFLNLSPALQALRGGISGAEDFADGQFRGQERENKENQERYRQAILAMSTGQDGPAGASVVAEAEGYGGRSETLTRQIAQKIILSRRRGLHRLKMNLHPAELGRLDIELSVKDGVLTASIRAENRAAYEALGERVAELKKALAEGGLELADLTLAHDDVESGRTVTAGLAELAEKRAARTRVSERPGEVHYLV